MDAALLKTIVDAGLGFGALIALVFVVINQMRLLTKMSDTITENTLATRELTEMVRQSRCRAMNQ